MPGTARATEEKNQVKEQQVKEEKEKETSSSSSCGIGKSSCCG